jgi:hypothetical protein
MVGTGEREIAVRNIASTAGIATLLLLNVGCQGGSRASAEDVECLASHLLLTSSSTASAHDTLPSLSYFYGRLDAQAPEGGWEREAVSRMRSMAKDIRAAQATARACDERMVALTRQHSTLIEAEIRGL